MPFRWISSAYATLPTPSESYAGKTIIVTGGNRGIGFEIAKHFVRLEAKKVILGVRDISPGQAAGVLIESSLQRNGVVEVWDLDMENFSSVKDFVSRAEKELKSIDILVLNAAICRGWWSLAEGHETNVLTPPFSIV